MAYQSRRPYGLVGNDIYGEEDYLIRLYQTRISKDAYLNVNGTHTKEAFFWEVLVRMESSRYYDELSRKSPPKRTKIAEAYELNSAYSDFRDSSGNFLMHWRRVFLHHMPTSLLVNTLPRSIAYPLVKNILHVDSLTKRAILRALGHKPLFGSEKVLPPRISDRFLQQDKPQEISLRKAVQERLNVSPELAI